MSVLGSCRARNVWARFALAGFTIAVLVSAGPVSAQSTAVTVNQEELEKLDVSRSVGEILDLLPSTAPSELGFSDTELVVVRAMTDPATASEYAFGDDPTTSPVIMPPGTSLVGTGSAQVIFDSFDLPPSGTMDANAVFLTSGGGITLGSPTTLIWFEFDGNIDLSQGLSINEGVVFARDNVPYWQSSFAGDTWEGGYLMPTITYSPNPFELFASRFQDGGFVQEDFPGFAIHEGNMLVFGIDSAYLEADGPLDELRYGLHLHWAEQPFTPGFVETYPERVGRTPDDFPLVRTNEPFTIGTLCCLAEAVETTTTATTTTTTTTEAPSTTEAATSTTVATGVTEVTIPEGSNLESGAIRRWIPITVTILGVALIIGGFWVYYRTHERRRPGKKHGARPGGGEEGGDDPRDTPRPIPYGEQVEHLSCDWAVYFHDGAKWVPLRQPSIASHECCVYRIEVATRIRSHVQAAKARQDAGDGRLYIPDFDFAWTGLNLIGHTSTRSGPRGRLDWMQGLGDPTDQAALAGAEPYVQHAQGEEPPELAVHLEHSEVTRVDVTLEAGCPEYTNTYKGWGSSSLDVLATQECTNDDPAPECPVELNAFGWSWGEVWGDLNYWFGDSAGTDIDELEGLAERRAALGAANREEAATEHPLKPLWDGHDHVTRDRATYEDHTGGTATNTVEQDDYTIWIESEYELDSGQIVPVRVWPTTERVSTHIESGIGHSIDVDGKMVPKNCEANGCHGHGECRCRPQFKIKFAGAVTTIEVEDKTFRIHRDPVAADRKMPPGAGGYRSWKLV